MKLPLLFAFIFLEATALHSAEYYVAKNGLDTNPGTLALPWKTIQKAATSLQAGDTVFVRKGVYKERVTITVSGSAVGGMITFRNYGTERAIIDATKLVSPDGNTGLFLIDDQSFLIIQGFELRNYRTSNRPCACRNLRKRDMHGNRTEEQQHSPHRELTQRRQCVWHRDLRHIRH